MLKPACHCEDERQLIVDAVEGWLSSAVRFLATDREWEDGQAEPGIVVVTKPAFSCCQLVLNDARVTSEIKPCPRTW